MAFTQQNFSMILDALTCPITLELFVDPVLASDGHTYERSAIVEWVKHHGTSPITRQTMKIKDLESNLIVKQLADQFRSSTTSNLSKELAHFSGGGTILNDEQKLNLNRLFLKDKQWSLIYKGTRDGFKASDFHRQCDNKGPTLTLIQTGHRFHMKNHHSIFGGYTTIPWSSRHGSFPDSDAFIFLFSGDQIQRFNIHSADEIAVINNPASGPIFGRNDIYVCPNANANHGSLSKFPSSYEDQDTKEPKRLSKRKHFLVDEIEVYMLLR